MTKLVGFHIHTNFSDGGLSLEDVLFMGIIDGYDINAISDHDTFKAFDQTYIQEEVQPSLKSSFNTELKPKSRAVFEVPYTWDNSEKHLDVIQAIELTTCYHSNVQEEIHIIGIYINRPDDEFLSYLGDIGNNKLSVRKLREERFASMIKKTNSYLGTELDKDVVMREIVGRGCPTRLHLAYALRRDFLNRGNNSDLVKDVLKRFKLGSNIPSVRKITSTIIGNNSPIYEKFPLGRVISTEDAIRKIIELKGIPVWAHPWRSDVYNLESKLEEFIKYSDGRLAIETQHKDSKNVQYHKSIDFCKKLAKKHKLLLVPSHDFHGRPYEENATLGKRYSNNMIRKIENAYRAITR